MDKQGPVRSMHIQANSGSGGKVGPDFICCVDGPQPKTHELRTFAEDGVTHKVHTTARIDVIDGFVGEFATYYLFPT